MKCFNSLSLLLLLLFAPSLTAGFSVVQSGSGNLNGLDVIEIPLGSSTSGSFEILAATTANVNYWVVPNVTEANAFLGSLAFTIYPNAEGTNASAFTSEFNATDGDVPYLCVQSGASTSINWTSIELVDEAVDEFEIFDEWNPVEVLNFPEFFNYQLEVPTTNVIEWLVVSDKAMDVFLLTEAQYQVFVTSSSFTTILTDLTKVVSNVSTTLSPGTYRLVVDNSDDFTLGQSDVAYSIRGQSKVVTNTSSGGGDGGGGSCSLEGSGSTSFPWGIGVVLGMLIAIKSVRRGCLSDQEWVLIN